MTSGRVRVAERITQVFFALLVVGLWTQSAIAETTPAPSEPSETMVAFYSAEPPPGTTEVLWHTLREHWSNPYRPPSPLHPPAIGHTHLPGKSRVAHPFVPRYPWQCVTPARLHADRSTNTGCALTVETEYGPKACLVVAMEGVVFLMFVED